MFLKKDFVIIFYVFCLVRLRASADIRFARYQFVIAIFIEKLDG